jgi:hypothetical protein
VAMAVAASAQPRAALHDFARNIAANNIPAAVAQSDPSLGADRLTALHTEFAKYGTYTDLTSWGFNVATGPTGTQCDLTGVVYFSTGPKAFVALLVKDASGTWKVLEFRVQP